MKIHELKNLRFRKVKRAHELARKAEDLPDGQELSDEEQEEMEKTTEEVNNLSRRIAALEAALQLQAQESETVEDGGDDETEDKDADIDPENPVQNSGGRIQRNKSMSYGYGEKKPCSEDIRGAKVARFIVGLDRAKRMSFSEAAAYIERRFGDRTVAKALNTTTVSDGGALIPQQFSNEIIELLRPQVAVRKLNPMTIDMSMGNLTIPRHMAGATAGYQGELDDIGLTDEKFDDLQLNAKKLTTMVPASNDLLRRAPFNVEKIIIDDMTNAMAQREDLAFILGDGANMSPVGFYHLAPPTNIITVAAPAGGGSTQDQIAAWFSTVNRTLTALVTILKQNMSRMIRPGWIMSPITEMFIRQLPNPMGGFAYRDEMDRGTLMGYPYATTAQLPTNLSAGEANNGAYLFIADFADVVLGDTLKTFIDISDSATYITNGSPVSAFQRDQTLLRIITEHDLNMRHLASVAYANIAGWIPNDINAVGGQMWYKQDPNTFSSAAPSTWGLNPNPPDGSNHPGKTSSNDDNTSADVPPDTQES